MAILKKIKLKKMSDKKTQKLIKAEKKPKKIRKIPKPLRGIVKVFSAIAGYFKGSWEELKQVRWPTRRAAWAMVLAVIAFTGLFILLITLLDIAFDQLFNLIIN